MLALGALALGCASIVGAGKPVFVPPGVVAPELARDNRTRSIAISVDPTLNSSFNRSTLTKMNYLFGLSGFIASEIGTSNNHQKGEKLSLPLRASLAKLDTAALARQNAGGALGAVSWLATAPVTQATDGTMAAKTAILDHAQSDQVVFVDYSYGMSPQFDTMRLIETIWIANRALPPGTKVKGGKDPRLAPEALVYATAILIDTRIANAGNRLKEDNAANWAANDSEKLRAALSEAFAMSGPLTRRALELTSDQATALADPNKPGFFFEGQTARVVSQDSSGTLVWLGHFAKVRYIR